MHHRRMQMYRLFNFNQLPNWYENWYQQSYQNQHENWHEKWYGNWYWYHPVSCADMFPNAGQSLYAI